MDKVGCRADQNPKVQGGGRRREAEVALHSSGSRQGHILLVSDGYMDLLSLLGSGSQTTTRRGGHRRHEDA